MADLTRELGVSMTTISRALSDYHYHSIGPTMKQKVLRPGLVVRGSSIPGDDDDTHVAVRNPADKFVGSAAV
jgi:hypothetical protein